MSAPETYRQELARSLSVRENIFITLSSVTPASSLFIIVPALITGLAGGSVAAMAIAGFIAIFVGLCYAELASRYPITGGEYTWAARLLGKPLGFAVFLLSLVTGVLIIAVIASGVGPYLSVIWDGFDSAWTPILVIVVTTAIASLTIRANAWVTGICLALEMIACVVLVVLGLAHISRGVATFVTPQTTGSGALGPVSWGVLFSLVPVALFAYNGYGASVYYAEETKAATRTMGRAILVSLLITVLAELVPLIAVVLGSSSLDALVTSDAPLNYFLLDRGGNTVNVLVSVGIAIAVFNAVIAIQIQIARLVFASARDRSWPEAVDTLLAKINSRTHTPIAATVLVGVAAAASGYWIPFDWLLIATGASVVVVYAIVAVAALRVRGAAATARTGYRMPLWPLPPLVVLGIMAYVLYQNITTDITPLVVSLVTLMIGVAWYFLFVHPRRGERWTLPDPQDDEGDGTPEASIV
jgi:amino acid transporter